jgi:hypothetical protein
VTQSTKIKLSTKNKKIKILCREPAKTLGKDCFAEGLSSWRSAKSLPLPRGKRKALGKGDAGRRRLVDRDFAESAPLPSALLSTKSLFADRLISALGKEPFAESLTWRSAKKALCRVSTRQLLAKMPVLGKVGFSCSAHLHRHEHGDFCFRTVASRRR